MHRGEAPERETAVQNGAILEVRDLVARYGQITALRGISLTVRERQIVALIQQLRAARLAKVPGVAETLDWAAALVSLHAARLSPRIIEETLGCVVKDESDLRKVRAELEAGRLAP